MNISFRTIRTFLKTISSFWLQIGWVSSIALFTWWKDFVVPYDLVLLNNILHASTLLSGMALHRLPGSLEFAHGQDFISVTWLREWWYINCTFATFSRKLCYEWMKKLPHFFEYFDISTAKVKNEARKSIREKRQ